MLSETDPDLRLGWRRGARWTAFLTSGCHIDEATVVTALVPKLRGRDVRESALSEYRGLRQDYLAARRTLKEARESLKKRGLRGNELKEARLRDLTPLEETLETRRRDFLNKLRDAVPYLALSVGDKIELDADEFRDKAREFLEQYEEDPFAIRMLASFATEENHETRCRRTEFDFVDSSGQLAFLKAVRELTGKVTEEKVRGCLFLPWKRADERLSLRFDPVEDRRYALLDRDPTASDNKSRSEWMANILAFHALRFFPCALTASGPATTGWSTRAKPPRFTWPIWQHPLAPDTVRSLLSLPELHLDGPPSYLRLYGVSAAYRSTRVENGDYLNFSPASAVFS